MNLSKKLLFAVSCLFLFSLPVTVVLFATEVVKNTGIDSTGKASFWDTKPFNQTLEKLPRNFKGNDVKKVFTKINKLVPPKSEFETNDVYKDKVQSILSNNEIYAFRPPKENDERHGYSFTHGTEVKYNSEAKSLIIRLSSRSIDPIEIILHGEKQKIKTYIGVNAYGAKRTVTKYHEKEYGLSIRYTPQLGETVLELDMSPEDAKKVKPNVDVLLLCQLIFPYIKSYYDHFAPKLDVPIDKDINQFYLVVDIVGIWVYDKSSGYIIRKIQNIGER